MTPETATIIAASIAAGGALFSAFIGALVAQVPTFFAQRIEQIKRKEAMRAQWDEAALNGVRDLMKKVVKLEYISEIQAEVAYSTSGHDERGDPEQPQHENHMQEISLRDQSSIQRVDQMEEIVSSSVETLGGISVYLEPEELKKGETLIHAMRRLVDSVQELGGVSYREHRGYHDKAREEFRSAVRNEILGH